MSRQDARRIAVRAQLLDAARPTDLLDTVRHLTMLQLDPTAAIAPNADLVAWTRLGSAYRPSELVEALDKRQLLELRAMLRPAEDLVLYRAEMADLFELSDRADWQPPVQRWIAANDGCRRDILDRLGRQGPLRSRDLPDTCVVPVAVHRLDQQPRTSSSCWRAWPRRGEVAIAGRRGRDRLWDLAERVYPDEPVVPTDEALRLRNERRLRALGIARFTRPGVPGRAGDVGTVGEPAVVEGVRGEWRVDPARSGSRSTGGRRCCPRSTGWCTTASGRSRSSTSTISWRCTSRWRSAAGATSRCRSCPRDRLVGKLDATADRKAGVLRVHAIHEDEPFDKPTSAATVLEGDRRPRPLARAWRSAWRA